MASQTGYTHSENCDESFINYDTSKLILQDMKLDSFDFISKFVKMNIDDCKRLVLKNIDIKLGVYNFGKILDIENYALD